MQTQDKTKKSNYSKASEFILKKSEVYFGDFFTCLDAKIDNRLVKTFYKLFIAIIIFREKSKGLILSELGAYIIRPDKAPAGTKRISNLLRSSKWGAKIIDDFLFSKTQKRLKEFKDKNLRALFLWDDSRLEKPESWFSEGLCSVSSSKAKRLMKIKRGFYNPPSNRVCVPGYQWTGILVSALGQIPSVCQMSWWTTRGKFKEQGTNIMYRMLKKCHQQFGRLVTHVLDRGYANARTLEWMFYFDQDFIVRWKSNHNLVTVQGVTKKTHLISRSYRAKSSRLVWDKERKKQKRVTIAFAKVFHPEFPDNELFIVIVRDKNNYNSPMYLLTSIKIETKQQAWEICFSYFHRWNIEQAFRFAKSELGMESARLWFFENRLKLLGIVTLVYDFMLSLIRNWRAWVGQFFRNWGHRTGNRYRKAAIPIYRLRAALALCLLFHFATQNSG